MSKQISIVYKQPDEEPVFKEVSAKNPLQAYKTAVKSFCPPETGGSNILKKEKDLTKDVLPMLYKAFSFNPDYPGNFRGNAMALIMSQTPELALLPTPKDLGFGDETSDILWVMLATIEGKLVDGKEDLELLRKAVVKAVGKKSMETITKQTQSLIKSIVFYFRFINQPQLLVCDDDDYISLIYDFIGVVGHNKLGAADGGAVVFSRDQLPLVKELGMFRTLQPYELLPVPVYSRSVFKAQPMKEQRFLEVYGVSALKMGYTTVSDMPKLDALLEKVETKLAPQAQKVIEQIKDEQAFLDGRLYDEESWMPLLEFDENVDAFYEALEEEDRINEDLELVEEADDIRDIGLTPEILRSFVRRGWNPKIPLKVDLDRLADGDFRLVPTRFDFSKVERQQDILKQLVEVRTLQTQFETKLLDDEERADARRTEAYLQERIDYLQEGKDRRLATEGREIIEFERKAQEARDIAREFGGNVDANKIAFKGKFITPAELQKKIMDLEAENATLRDKKYPNLEIYLPTPGLPYLTDSNEEDALADFEYKKENTKILRKKKSKKTKEELDEEVADLELKLSGAKYAAIKNLRFARDAEGAETSQRRQNESTQAFSKRVLGDRERDINEVRIEAQEEVKEIRGELRETQKELKEAQKENRELQEEIDEAGDETNKKQNEVDLLEAILDRLGVNVEKVKSEGMEFGAQDFITTQAFEDLVVEPIERSLFR